MSDSVAWELQLAVVAALEGDSGLVALTEVGAVGGSKGIYDSRVPLGKPVPYIVVVDNTEAAFDTFSVKGQDGLITGKCYAADKAQAIELYRRVRDRLDRMPLALQNGKQVTFGRVQLLGAGLEEDAMRVLWSYRAMSR